MPVTPNEASQPRTAPDVDRRRLIESNVDLAYSVARRFTGRGEELDDLRHVALWRPCMRRIGSIPRADSRVQDSHRRPLSRSSTEEVARYGDWSEAQVCAALAEPAHRYADHWGSADGDRRLETGTLDGGLDNVEDRVVVDDLLGRLQERERSIIEMRYFDELGQSAIGERVGLSQIHVCRLIKLSLAALRATASAQG